jgi:hypothetical protein
VKYRKKPIVIDAIQWTGKNISEVSAFVKQRLIIDEQNTLHIKTGNVNTVIVEGSYIIIGPDNVLFPCSEKAFERIYEPVEVHETTIDVIGNIYDTPELLKRTE